MSEQHSDVIERILADRERRNLDAEAYDLRLGLPLLRLWYCRRCHHRHACGSAIGISHEQHGDPRAIRAAKLEGMTLLADQDTPS